MKPSPRTKPSGATGHLAVLEAEVEALRREVDRLRAERLALLDTLKALKGLRVREHIACRYAEAGLPGCGLDPG